MKKFWIVTTVSAAMMMCAQVNAATRIVGGGPHIAAASTSSMDGVNGGFPSFIFALFHFQ